MEDIEDQQGWGIAVEPEIGFREEGKSHLVMGTLTDCRVPVPSILSQVLQLSPRAWIVDHMVGRMPGGCLLERRVDTLQGLPL